MSRSRGSAARVGGGAPIGRSAFPVTLSGAEVGASARVSLSARGLRLLVRCGVFLLGLTAGVEPADPAAALPQRLPQVLVDSARAELERGRPWHAARLLRRIGSPERTAEGELLRLRVRAEAGWENWSAVLALLEEGDREWGQEDPDLLYFLGRALEGRERWDEAAGTYGRLLTESAELGEELRLEAEARRLRALAEAGAFPEVGTGLVRLAGEDSVLAAWTALSTARSASKAGSEPATRSLLSAVGIEEVGRRGWALPAEALLASGDSAGSEMVYWLALGGLPASERAVAWERIGDLRLARGDSLGARGAYQQVLRTAPRADAALSAALVLVQIGFDSIRVALTGARRLASAGRYPEASDAYAAYETLLGPPLPDSVRLEVAETHLEANQWDKALALLEAFLDSDRADVGARALAGAARALRGLGRGTRADALEDTLIERFPSRPEAVEVAFRRGTSAEARGDVQAAIEAYRRAAGWAPALRRAAEARMRLGRALLFRGDHEEAAAVFREYLEAYPEGAFWDEAAFWAGRALLAKGSDAEGRALLDSLVSRFPLSYYSVRAREVLGRPFFMVLPPEPTLPPPPPWLREGLAALDRLLLADMEEGAQWMAASLVERARREQPEEHREELLLLLATELNRRGLTRGGINVGWELRRRGRGWDRVLLQVVYPLPHRELVLAEARELGLDPFLVAGLIRQESAFWAEARSRADARGLMQLLPSTARALAGRLGIGGFDPDQHLFQVELNLHLGTLFLGDLARRFDEDLSLLLVAYNAGPTRARRWRAWLEDADPARFVERIPFAETRGYVKNVLANRELYEWLYGGGAGMEEQ